MVMIMYIKKSTLIMYEAFYDHVILTCLQAFCADHAMKTCVDAVQVFGGNGVYGSSPRCGCLSLFYFFYYVHITLIA